MSQYLHIRMSQDVRAKAAEKGHFIPIMTKVSPGRWKGICAKCARFVVMRISPATGMPVKSGPCLEENCDG